MLISILLKQSLDGCTGTGCMRSVVTTKIIEKLAAHKNPLCAIKNPTCTHKNPARFGPSEVRATKSGTPPHYAIFGRKKEGIFKSCPRVLKLWILLQRGLGEMFEGDSADRCAENVRSCLWGSEQTWKRGPPSA
jgi:hypothetical protein